MMSDRAFLAGGGEMGARMRAHDWAATPLGLPEAWPVSLKSVLSACLNSPLLGTVLWGPDLLFLYNDAYIPSLADRHPTALGRPVAEVWGDVWAQFADLFHNAMRTGEGFSNTGVPIIMTRNGIEELTYWDFTAAPIRDEQGRIAGLLNQGVEITERVLAEGRLRDLNRTLEGRVAEALAARAVFAEVVETSSSAILILDIDYNVLAINRANVDAIDRVYGKRPKPGDNLLALLADMPEHQEQVRETWGRALRGEEFVIVDTFGDVTHEMVAFEVRFNSLRDRDGRLIGASHTAHDVTERVRAQAELESTQAALRQAQKMEAIGQLTGGLAHDFNNLLTGIMGNLELLQMRVAQGRTDNMDRFVTAAQGAGRRAAALTQRLLAFSRRQTLDPKPVDVNRLIAGMEDMVNRTIGPAISLEVVGAAGLWPALIDAGQLENALLNLCLNARDAMPDGGRLTIETANKWIDERGGRERDLPAGQYLSLCVTDTGTGMSDDTIARAFDPFFTTKPLGEGTGLGLSMIYGFARQSGGQVRIYSEIDQGTTICIYLPRYVGEADGPLVDATETVDANQASRGAATILIVDDEPTIRHLAEEVLTEQGYRVIVAADGPEGLRRFQSEQSVDLLITDVGLPNGMNGRQVADAARMIRPDLPVLFITGYAENAAVGNGHMEPGMELLTKPFAIFDLTRRVRMMLEA